MCIESGWFKEIQKVITAYRNILKTTSILEKTFNGMRLRLAGFGIFCFGEQLLIRLELGYFTWGVKFKSQSDAKRIIPSVVI